MSVAILVPVLGRPHRVRPLLDAFAAATPEPHAVYFIPDPDDEPERAAIAGAGGQEIWAMTGGWAAKINAAIRLTDEPLIFLGADDLEPEPGWLTAAAARLRDGVQVVGVNDMIDRRGREHATHFLMTREYAALPTLDGARGPLTEAYDHSFVDNELIATARHRGAYAYAPDAVVRHLHPMNGTAPDDDTYLRGRARFRRDRQLFRQRSALWT